MNGHVFEMFNEGRDKWQFIHTVEALGQYINVHLKFAGDLAPLYKDLEAPSIEKPSHDGLNLTHVADKIM